MKNYLNTSQTIIILVLLMSCVLLSCNKKRQNIPNGWIQKVNNNSINRITLDGCAIGEKKHVKCPNNDEHGCFVKITYNDESKDEEWAQGCEGGYSIFDDGTFSYFYGTKQP